MRPGDIVRIGCPICAGGAILNGDSGGRFVRLNAGGRMAKPKDHAAGTGTPAPSPEGATTDAPALMNARQAADYLRINEKKVYQLATEGRLPGTKVTGKWLFPRDLVDQWLLESSHRGVLADRLILTGSDDPLLHRIVSRLAQAVESRALVVYSATGTRLGLRLLAAGRADVCAVHWGPATESDVRHSALLNRFPGYAQWVLVRAFRREQGLMVSPRIVDRHGSNLKTLVGAGVRWAFRQDGSGSQRFLEETCAAADTSPDRLECTMIAQSEREAASHVSMGEADVAPGVRAAATECGLDFLATGEEAFDLALPRDVYFRTLFQRLADSLKSEETRSAAARLGGYDLAEAGRLVWSAP